MVVKMRSILVINPNSTVSMTDALKPLVKSLGFTNTRHEYFTAPSGPKSINDEDDAAESVKHCLPHLIPVLGEYDGFLVCCYSQHPLVSILKSRPEIEGTRKLVTGIFEASVASSLQAIHPKETFGIVSTEKVWDELLTAAVTEFFGFKQGETGDSFAGVETTGLSAVELHDLPPEQVRQSMKHAVKRLLTTSKKGNGDVGAICLGCAGMAGMDEIVREACVEQLGEVKGQRIRIIDGVVAGVAWLEGSLRSGM